LGILASYYWITDLVGRSEILAQVMSNWNEDVDGPIVEGEIVGEADLFDIGYRAGVEAERKRVVSLLDNGDPCGLWAVDVIEGRY